MNKKRKQHIHCPVNGWDCPYYTNNGHPCRCTLEDPLKDCDDFGTFWEEGDDFIDDDWEEVEDRYTLDDLGNDWW